MRAALAGGLAAVAALSLVAGGAGANLPGTTYVDKGGGYSITVPTTWETVPRTVAQIKALAAKLKKKASTADLATFYTQLISTAAQQQELSAYRFQAFAWPDSLSEPVPTEVSVGVVPGKKSYTAKSFPAIGAVYANALAANKGSKVTVPKVVTLPAGKAEFIEAVIPVGSGVSNGIELYLIPRGKLLYELSFQIEASQLSGAQLFTSIAQHFKFTT